MMRMQQNARRPAIIAVLLAISLVAILGIVALSLDGGCLLSERRRAQAVADSAALAAASELFRKCLIDISPSGDASGSARNSALAEAATNGYVNNVTESVVIVNIPPTSGHFVGVRGYAEVVVEYKQARGFSRIFESEPVPVRARAVARGAYAAADVGILVLDSASKSSLNANGGGTVTVDDTPVVVRSTHAEAAIAGGGGSLTAPDFYIAGGYSTSGGGTFDGNMHTGRTGFNDPLRDLPAPDPSTMPLQRRRKLQHTSGTLYLQPGVYRGGISVSSSGAVVLAPGIYYMDGGGFSFSGMGSLTGNGVMIYNAPGNGNADKISVSGQGQITLTPPTDGMYAGISIFQARDKDLSVEITGNSGTTSITGTFYAPNALLKVTGNGGVVNVGSQYVSHQLELGGNGSIHINWKPEHVARSRAFYLVE